MSILSKLRKKRFEYLSFLVNEYYRANLLDQTEILCEITRMFTGGDEYEILAQKHLKKAEKEPALPLSKLLLGSLAKQPEAEKQPDTKKQPELPKPEISEYASVKPEVVSVYNAALQASDEIVDYYYPHRRPEPPVWASVKSLSGEELFALGESLADELRNCKKESYKIADFLIELMMKLQSDEFENGVFSKEERINFDYDYWDQEHNKTQDWQLTGFVSVKYEEYDSEGYPLSAEYCLERSNVHNIMSGSDELWIEKAAEKSSYQKLLYQIVLEGRKGKANRKALEKLYNDDLLQKLADNTDLDMNYRLAAKKKLYPGEKILDFYADNLEFLSPYFIDEIRELKSGDMFKLGEVMGEKLCKNDTAEMAEIVDKLIKELGSKKFTDGVFLSCDFTHLKRF
jgi:hypothetical protein